MLTDPLLQRRTLECLAGARNYNRWLADLVQPYLGACPLEIGSGLGDIAALWLESGVPRFTLSELNTEDVARLRQRFAHDNRIEVLQLDVTDPAKGIGPFSAAVAMNVLEHIERDSEALAGVGRLLVPGGAVVLFVPAHGWAMSAFDRAIGHWRRYSPCSLRDTIVRAGLRPELIRHVNAPGLAAWVLGMKLLKRTPTDSVLLRLYDQLIVPITRRVEGRVSVPFGQSLFAVARVEG